MSVVINQSQSEVYFGHLKLGGASALKPGVVVVPDHSAGTAAAPADDTAADAKGLVLVCNYDSYADTDRTNSKDFTVAVGEYLRLKALQIGDIFTTDQFKGTYGDLNVDDIFAPGDAGTFEAIAARTPAVKVQIIEKTTIYGENALKFIVIAV